MVFADTALSATGITVLLAALGLSSTAGLRAYLPLLAVGVAGNVAGPFDGKLIPLQGNFAALSNPLVLVVLGALAVGEFTIDKLPVVDHLSDAVHTVIRPLAGAMIMAGTANSLSDTSQLGAAVLGGALALGFHGVKATTRPAVTATTAGLGNPIVSLIEDMVVVVAVLALVLAPIVGIVLMVLLVFGFGRLLARVVRRFRRSKSNAAANAAQVVNVAPNRGRGRRGKKMPQIAPPNVVTGALVPPAVAASPSAPLAAGPATGGAASPTAATLAGTQQPAPYGPYGPAYPQPAPGAPPQPTQAFPGQTPVPGAYPGDATTLPGSY